MKSFFLTCWHILLPDDLHLYDNKLGMYSETPSDEKSMIASHYFPLLLQTITEGPLPELGDLELLRTSTFA